MPETVTVVQCPVIVTVLDTPLTLTTLSLHVIVFDSPTPATLIWPPGGAVVGIEGMLGMLGIDGMLGMLGMVTPGILGIVRVDLFTMKKPTAPATTKNRTAATPKITHGIPADDLRGGGVHGAP